jgi:hypothetical protein
MSLNYLPDFASARKPASRPDHIREPEILALLGRDRCHFSIGVASRWLPNDIPPIRRLAEFVADIIYPSLGEVVARRIATAAITDIAQHGAYSPVEIIIAAIGRAVDLLDEDAAQLRNRLAAIRRRREELAEIAAERKPRLVEVRRLEREVASTRRAIARHEIAFRGNKPLLRLVRLGKTRDLPRAERALAAARAVLPAYHLGAAARRTRDELKDRLRQLRDCRRALTAAARRITAACPIGTERPIQSGRHG